MQVRGRKNREEEFFTSFNSLSNEFEVMDLTERQLAILLWVANENANDRRVTIRRIMEEFDIRSPNGIVCHLTALRNKGFLKEPERSGRSNYRHAGTIMVDGYKLFVKVSDKFMKKYEKKITAERKD